MALFRLDYRRHRGGLPGFGSAPHTKGQKAPEWPARGQRAGTKRASLGARGRRAALGTGSPTLGAGPAAGPVPAPPHPAEARKGPVPLPSPPGMHGGRSCGPRTRREPSSGEEAAPVTAMAAESALQVVEKLQARLTANPDPKKVGEWATGGEAGVGRGAAP